MNIILLPGMDGTGLLFNRLLAQLNTPYTVIPLPKGAEQSYAFLVQHICVQLPQEDCVLLAESFSGPIAAEIAHLNMPQIKAVIFIATFLKPPHPVLLYCAAKMPLKALLKLPFTSYFIRCFLIGAEYPVELFFEALSKVSQIEIKSRLTAIAQLKTFALSGAVQLPALYLQAHNDYLVGAKHIRPFKTHFSNLTHYTLKGTHFLAQSNAADCAGVINTFIACLEGKSP